MEKSNDIEVCRIKEDRNNGSLRKQSGGVPCEVLSGYVPHLQLKTVSQVCYPLLSLLQDEPELEIPNLLFERVGFNTH